MWGEFRRRSNKPTPGPGVRVTKELIEWAYALLREGMSVTEAAKRLGVGRSTLYKALKKKEESER
ncbi:helix-turn-helix domain-containing protein [Dermabacteraceae bacterium P13115]